MIQPSVDAAGGDGGNGGVCAHEMIVKPKALATTVCVKQKKNLNA